MASNYNRKSASSGSRKPAKRGRQTSASSRQTAGTSRTRSSSRTKKGGSLSGAARGTAKTGRSSTSNSSYQAIPGGRMPSSDTRIPTSRTSSASSRQPLTSVRVGDLDRAERANRAHSTYQRYLVRIGIALGCVLALVVGGFALYNSNAFAIEQVSVTGVEHLTSAEMTELASVPANTTLLRVDTGAIRDRLMMDAWVDDVSVNRIFPSTLELAVTERTIAAVVQVPTENAQATQNWAIASDGMWLMSIPDQDSDAGRRTSPKVYEDAAAVLQITDVPYGTKPEVGTYCSDANVNNALAIVSGMTTSLADQVKTVAATETESTTLTLDNNIEIVFGTAEDIREKERVCLEIMEQHPGEVAYINVRVVARPTWRA